MNKARRSSLAFAFVFLLAACAAAPGDDLTATQVWARPAQAGANSAVFFFVDNPGSADTLLSAASNVAAVVELHRTSMQDGVMRMQHQASVPIPAGRTEFKPGGLHVMLIGLERDLQAGDTFEVTLTFQAAGTRTLAVEVREP